jgi:polyisoprenoid-binding protein YceI
MNRSIRRAAIFCSLVLFPTLAAAKLANPTDAAISFRALGPAGMRVEGRTNKMAVADDGANIVLTIPVTSLTTGIGLRDKHMHEKYLESAKFPEAEVTVARSSLHFPEDGKSVKAWAPATLKLHGKTKPITLHYKVNRTGNSYDVSGNADVKVTDYDIELPSHLGVSVKPEVAVDIHFVAQDL